MIFNNSSGAALPDLTDPASPNDVISGKEYIDGDGEKQIGTFVDQIVDFAEGTLSGEYSNLNITELGAFCFAGKPYLTSVVLPNVTKMADTAFGRCVRLTSIYMPSCKISGESAFNNCTALERITVNKDFSCNTLLYGVGRNIEINIDGTIEDWVTLGSHGMAYHGYYLRANDVAQNDIVVNNTVSILSAKCLTRCLFSSISFRGNIQRVAENAFNNCTQTTIFDFKYNTEVPMLSNKNAFTGINANAQIIVPDALYTDWINASNWSDPTIAQHIIKESEYVG